MYCEAGQVLKWSDPNWMENCGSSMLFKNPFPFTWLPSNSKITFLKSILPSESSEAEISIEFEMFSGLIRKFLYRYETRVKSTFFFNLINRSVQWNFKSTFAGPWYSRVSRKGIPAKSCLKKSVEWAVKISSGSAPE